MTLRWNEQYLQRIVNQGQQGNISPDETKDEKYFTEAEIRKKIQSKVPTLFLRVRSSLLAKQIK